MIDLVINVGRGVNFRSLEDKNRTRGECKSFVTIVSIMIMIVILHIPYTVSNAMETIFVYTRDKNTIPFWFKYYHLLSNTIQYQSHL